jgi:hypothetical protein
MCKNTQVTHPFGLNEVSDTGANYLAVAAITKFLSPEFPFLSRTESSMRNLLDILKARVLTTQIARQWMPSI